MPLCGELVFVDQPAEQVAAVDAIEADDIGHLLLGARPQRVRRRPLGKCAVRPVHVVMGGIGREDVLEVAPADDKDPVEAFCRDPILWGPLAGDARLVREVRDASARVAAFVDQHRQ